MHAAWLPGRRRSGDTLVRRATRLTQRRPVPPVQPTRKKPPDMRYLDAGTTTRISKIGLGTWQFGARGWGYGEGYAGQEAKKIVRRAIDLGVTLFDTAEIYGLGRSERILGAALGERRASVFLATKILPLLPVAPVVEQRAVASANRLGTHLLDLYQVHQPNPLVRDGTIMRGMSALQRVGLVGEVGVSNYSLRRWQAAEEALGHRVLSNQVRYSLADRSPEGELLPFAAARGRVVIAYSPLAQGLLSGRYDRASRPANRVRAGNPLFLPENLDRASDLIGVLRKVADAHAATPAQITLARVIRHPAVTTIPGASSVGQLESNAAAADIELASDEYDALCAASDLFRPLTERAAVPAMLRAGLRRYAGSSGRMGRDEQLRFPALPRNRHTAAGYPLPDLPAHGGLSSRPGGRGQCRPHRALSPRPPRGARRQFWQVTLKANAVTSLSSSS